MWKNHFFASSRTLCKNITHLTFIERFCKFKSSVGFYDAALLVQESFCENVSFRYPIPTLVNETKASSIVSYTIVISDLT